MSAFPVEYAPVTPTSPLIMLILVTDTDGTLLAWGKLEQAGSSISGEGEHRYHQARRHRYRVCLQCPRTRAMVRSLQLLNDQRRWRKQMADNKPSKRPASGATAKSSSDAEKSSSSLESTSPTLNKAQAEFQRYMKRMETQQFGSGGGFMMPLAMSTGSEGAPVSGGSAIGCDVAPRIGWRIRLLCRDPVGRCDRSKLAHKQSWVYLSGSVSMS